jgi:hypothetical protein
LTSIIRRWSSACSAEKGASSMIPAPPISPLHAVGGGQQGVPVGDVGLDRDGAVAPLRGEGAIRSTRRPSSATR